MSCDIWNAITAISSLGMFVVVILTAIYGYRQLNEIKKARWSEVLSTVLDELGTPEMEKSRRYVLSMTLPPLESLQPGAPEYETLYKVSTSFDKVGLMVAEGLIPERTVLMMFHIDVIECWEKLYPYIEHIREKRDYQVWFEKLYRRAIIYREKGWPKDRDS